MTKKDIETAGEQAEKAFEKSRECRKAYAIFDLIITAARESGSWENAKQTREAVRQLSKMQASAVITALELLKYGDEVEKIAACHALGEIKARGAVAGLIMALEDESERVRLHAARAIKKIEDKEGLLALLLLKNAEKLDRLYRLVEEKLGKA